MNRNITNGRPRDFKGGKYGIALFGLLIIIIYQYMGLPEYIPAFKGLNIDFFLSLAVLIWIIMHDGLKGILRYGQTKIFVYFIVFSCFSIFTALIATKVYNILIMHVGNLMLFCICYCLFKNFRRIHIFASFFVAMHFLLVFLNINSLIVAGNAGGIRAGFFVGDLNDFAWSLSIAFPLAIYLILTTSSRVMKLASIGLVITILSGIVLTHSRGAAIAVTMSALFIILTSRRRLAGLLVLACAIPLVFAFAPDSYVQRLETINTYKEDSSARGRMMAWRAAVAMAIDHPLGVGPGNFPNVYGRFYRDKYADSTVYSPNRWIAIHSIYFQALAEYGFLGAFLLLALIYQNFVSNFRAGNKWREAGQSESELVLSRTISASLTAFAIGGIFLGNISYPHIYILTSMTMGLNAIANQTVGAEKTGL